MKKKKQKQNIADEMEKLCTQRSGDGLDQLGSVLFPWTLGPETEENGSVGTAVNSAFACQY